MRSATLQTLTALQPLRHLTLTATNPGTSSQPRLMVQISMINMASLFRITVTRLITIAMRSLLLPLLPHTTVDMVRLLLLNAVGVSPATAANSQEKSTSPAGGLTRTASSKRTASPKKTILSMQSIPIHRLHPRTPTQPPIPPKSLTMTRITTSIKWEIATA